MSAVLTTIERTVEGGLITFEDGTRAFSVFYTAQQARVLGSRLVAAGSASPANPDQLLAPVAEHWTVTYLCGCTETSPVNDFRDQCPRHGAEPSAPPRLVEAA